MADPQYTVLLVDDEKFLLEIYSIKFHKRGFNVFACESAEVALGTLQRGYQPDVILFDITMPGMSGYELLEALAQLKLARKALKIALTNENQPGEQERIKELGGDAHLTKAKYTAGEVVDIVEKFLHER